MFKKYYDSCGGIIKLVDIAPECDVRGDFLEKPRSLHRFHCDTATDYDGAVDAFKSGRNPCDAPVNAINRCRGRGFDKKRLHLTVHHGGR